MATLRDLFVVYKEIDQTFSLFGASAAAVKRFNDLSDEVRDAIMEENGLKSPDEALVLSRNTPLGEKSLAAMEALKLFCPQD